MQNTEDVFLPEDLPGISLETGLMYCNNNRKLYRDLLIDFLERRAGTVEKFKTMMQMGDLSSAGRTAHSMKSSAGIIGANELSKASNGITGFVVCHASFITNLQNVIHIFSFWYKRSVLAMTL